MSITNKSRMSVAAHRGDSYNYYENTMQAFEKAIEAGADMIETDVRLSADGITVLMHDDTVNRTTDKKGKICEMTTEQISELNAGDAASPQGVPTLESVVSLAKTRKITLNIEIKEYYSPENEQRCIECIEKTVACVDKYGMESSVVLNSFDAWVLEYVYKKYGKKYLLHGFYPYSIMFNVNLNPDDYLYCACIFDNRNKKLYDDLISKGIEPWIGASVTQASLLSECLDYGARLITTNNPYDIIKKLKEMGRYD